MQAHNQDEVESTRTGSEHDNVVPEDQENGGAKKAGTKVALKTKVTETELGPLDPSDAPSSRRVSYQDVVDVEMPAKAADKGGGSPTPPSAVPDNNYSAAAE
jgi:hypothetical protein